MTDLAPHGREHVILGPIPSTSTTWWQNYAAQLHESGIGATSRRVIEEDANYIVDRGVFGAGEPSDGGWPSSRERSGLVMGAVQSGKTASMMAVAAKALDRGVDAVIVLSGTRTALWRQTFERVVEQLDFTKDRHLRRILVPNDASPEGANTILQNLYSLTAAKARRAIPRRRPILTVAMKHVAHLEQLNLMLHEVVYPVAALRDGPFHILVIDDEADDSSVVDADAEQGADDIFIRRKQIPRRIVDLWESRQRPGFTVNKQVYATYLAYTATPQANFLQDDSNPLAPRDFVASLRTPGAEGTPMVRSSTYRVPEGINAWYTGGDVFYKSLSSIPLCRPTDRISNKDLVPDAVRAFLVSSAVRLLRDDRRLGPFSASQASFATKTQAKASSPEVASMLIHPSSATDEQFEVANELLNWSSGSTEDLAPSSRLSDRRLGSAGIEHDMQVNASKWTRWLDEYQQSAMTTMDNYPESAPRAVPTSADWPAIRQLMLDEIIPATSVSVINSEETADDRPDFSSTLDGETWRAPRNLSTIFVSGNVMSRGLTLEGLTTTLFTRTADAPAADTQMQMQRWFGYRGKYIDLCRVFMPRVQIDTFFRYHQDDEALRRDVLRTMESSGKAPDVTVLQGRSYRATGKISGVRGLPLYPGPKPFIQHMNAPGADDDNLALVRDLFQADHSPMGNRGSARGLLLEETFSLNAAADILDRLRYSEHGPGPDGPEARRWNSIAHHAWISESDPALPLYRAPLSSSSVDLGLRSPYTIAAYFRFWAACLVRRVPGVVTADEPPVIWDLLDLAVLRERQPKFRVGLRFGGGAEVRSGPLAELAVPVRTMRRKLGRATQLLESTWGSRNERDGEIRGDEMFDYEMRQEVARTTPTGARRPGSDGLILFHPIERGDGEPTIAIGLNIPLGGPDHMRAQRGSSNA